VQHISSAGDLTQAASDRFAYVRDRELAGLIESLEDSNDLIAFATIFGEALSERETMAICAALDKAVDVLSELRKAP
jgi:hypothetical protein